MIVVWPSTPEAASCLPCAILAYVFHEFVARAVRSLAARFHSTAVAVTGENTSNAIRSRHKRVWSVDLAPRTG